MVYQELINNCSVNSSNGYTVSVCVIYVTFNLYVGSSDYPFFFRVIILPLVASSAGVARDPLILLLTVKSRVRRQCIWEEGNVTADSSARP